MLCTVNNCVVKDNFPLTDLRWTIRVFYYLFIIILSLVVTAIYLHGYKSRMSIWNESKLFQWHCLHWWFSISEKSRRTKEGEYTSQHLRTGSIVRKFTLLCHNWCVTMNQQVVITCLTHIFVTRTFFYFIGTFQFLRQSSVRWIQQKTLLPGVCIPADRSKS